jgi:hypothetical protein
MLGRFGDAKTWDEALAQRTGKQQPPLPFGGTPDAPTRSLSGQSPKVDQSVTEMFVESLRRTAWVQKAASSLHPFSTVASVIERPLMVAVVWPDPTISDQEQEVARELGIHLAGAFLFAVMDNH